MIKTVGFIYKFKSPTYMIYEPQEDSQLILKFIKKYATGTVLDMGTGSGILAQEALKSAKKVIAVDINPEAIEFAKNNSDKAIEFKVSDLFSNVKGKYQLIIFNPPYLPEDKLEDRESRQITTGGKHGYEIIEKFLEQANEYLEDNGKILLVFSSLTNKDCVDEIINRNLLQFKLLETEILPMFEQLFLYVIEKSSLLKKLKEVKELRYFTKGHRGYIYIGKLGTKKVTIKVKNPKSKASGRIKNEVQFLKILNKENIGPKLLKVTNDYFIYEFVEGNFFPQFIKDADKPTIIKTIKDLLKQCYEMDKLNINKEEMHHPNKHIIINSKPTLLDFERANKSKKPHNLTQFCQYLSTMKPELKKRKVFVNITKLRELSRDYKKSYDNNILDKIASSIL